MKHRRLWLLLLIPSLAIAIALPVTRRDAATDPRLPSYAMKGVVVSVETDDRLLLIEHDEIPGFMPAMTMYFRVDPATHRAARVGERIEATMVRHPKSLVLQNVRLTPPQRQSRSESSPASTASPAVAHPAAPLRRGPPANPEFCIAPLPPSNQVSHP
jgi:Cu/Ag efflux protein CusF